MIGAGPTESLDGTVHLTYFDVDTQASFVWSGSAERPIEVSIGGYGEPVMDEIWPVDVPAMDAWTRLSPMEALRVFRAVCDQWLTENRPAVTETWPV
jgi:hypothetical protein